MTTHQNRPNTWWFCTISDFLAGTMGGFAGKLIEYPFDTVKVRLQSQAGVRGVVTNVGSHVRSLIEREGYSALYRGLPLPLFGTMLETACLFATVGQVKKTLYGTTVDVSPKQTAIAGAISGLAVSFILTPIELIKCRMQVNPSLHFSGPANKLRPYKSTLDCITRTMSEGGIRALYKGHVATMMRESPGTAAWFGTYELIIRGITPTGKNREDLSPVAIILSGGLSGVAYNTAFYPADTVKTRIQTLPDHMSSTIPKMFNDIYQKEGIRGFYRGISPTIIRAMPANGAVFLCYELVTSFFSRYRPIQHNKAGNF